MIPTSRYEREKFDMVLNTQNRREKLNGTDRAELESRRNRKNLASMIPDSGSEEFWTDKIGRASCRERV